jgi:hypothetical protein
MRKLPDPEYSSPKWTFVAAFADGVITRMTTFCANGVADLERGIALARAAYESRTHGKAAPQIVAGKFVEPDNGDKLIREYTADELKAAQKPAKAAAGHA